MKIKIGIKDGVTVSEAMNILVHIANENQRIKNDIHTNKYYDLIKGKMWFKGDGVGKMWDLFCNSREGQQNAKETLNIF